MRIGIDARFAGIHERGIGRYVYELVEALIARSIQDRHELVLFVTSKNAYLWNDTEGVKKVISDIPWYGIAEQIKFPLIIYKAKVDLMHFPHYNVPVLYKKPYVVTIHDLLLNRYPSSNASTKNELTFFIKYQAYKTVLKSTLKNAKHIISVSNFTKKEIEKLYPNVAKSITVIFEANNA